LILPRFLRPPVSEVALSIMFDAVKLRTVHFGLFWNRVRNKFPELAEQPPLARQIEIETELRRSPEPAFRFEPVAVPMLRFWFLNESGTELLQLQQDRFARNWRAAANVDYPSYDRIRGPFEEDLKSFEIFLRDERIGELTPVQCEVTYVNHIRRAGVWRSHGDLERVFTQWASPAREFLPHVEDGQFVSRYQIRSDGRFVGRLHTSVQPAFAEDDPIFLLTLTARGNPLGTGLDGALKFLDLGHEWIVRGFAELTTVEMHRAWERES